MCKAPSGTASACMRTACKSMRNSRFTGAECERRMKILGIDPGFAILGYGIINTDGNSFISECYGAITTPAHMDMNGRLKCIYNGLTEIIGRYKPDVAAIEELFFNKNAKTALLVGQARGVAIVACANMNIEIFEYTPLQVKQALAGYGRAEKKQVQFMVKHILNLKEIPKPDDTADALAVAVCHANSAQYNRLTGCK